MFVAALLSANIPNLHPLVVHFPIALALTALAFRLVLVIKPTLLKLEWSATTLTILAGISGAVAWLAGKQAVKSLGSISMAAEKQLSRHADLAGITVLLLLAAAVLAIIHNLPQSRKKGPSRLTASSAFFVLLLAAGFMTVTADLGGSLVYRYGVAVKPATTFATLAPAIKEVEATEDVIPQPIQDWDPAQSAAVSYTINGEGLILLPGVFDDVAVTAVVDLKDFIGDVALVHHARATTDWEGFLLTQQNKAQLVQVAAGGKTILKGTSLVFPHETTELRTTAAQGHFKGLVDGDMVVHGHSPSGKPGRVGIYYSGQGTLKVQTITAETTTDH